MAAYPKWFYLMYRCPLPPPAPPYVRITYTAVPVARRSSRPQCLVSYKRPALPHRFRLLLPALGPLSRHLLKTLRKSVSHFHNRFRPSVQLLEPSMPSADFCQSILSPLDDNSTRLLDRSPRVMRTHLHAYTCHIYVHAFRVGIVI